MGRGKVELKFKFHPEHDMKAQRVSKGINLLFKGLTL